MFINSVTQVVVLFFANIYTNNTYMFSCMVREYKSVPLQAWCGPEVSRKLRFPYFMTTAQEGG